MLHHGIHGNYNKNIKIKNLVIENFKTHRIQLNGFDNIVFDTIDIGPTSSKVYFYGEHGQELLSRMTLQFSNFSHSQSVLALSRVFLLVQDEYQINLTLLVDLLYRWR